MKRITSFRSRPTKSADAQIAQIGKEQENVLEVSNKKDAAKDDARIKQKFSFGRMVNSFQSVTFTRPDKVYDKEGALPNCPCFLSAIDETILLFDELGAAFGFVSREIQIKNNLLKTYSQQLPTRYISLENAVAEEMNDGSAYTKPPPSGARTLLRLMWALKFIDCLLLNLLPEKDVTLKEAVANAYDRALAEHHAWAIRTSVKAAINVLPSKEHFVKRIGATKQLVEKLSAILAPMVSAMYKYYEKRKLLDLQ